MNLAFDYTRDTVTYTMPLSCLTVGPSDVLRLYAQVNTSDGEPRFYTDESAKTTRFAVG